MIVNVCNKLIALHIDCINRLSKKAHHYSMADAADRKYIMNYVMSCIPYIKKEPDILEFDGGIVYANEVIKRIGGNVKFATKKGRLERNNIITYEFDIEHECLQDSFDLIIATQVLGSFVDVCKITKTLKKMLKPNGVLIITVSGPAYPKIRGLVSFFSKEGLVRIGREAFGIKNVKNIRSYGDPGAAICMLNYLPYQIFINKRISPGDYDHEVINGILCVNKCD